MIVPLLLHEAVAKGVNHWRATDYPHLIYPEIGEILRWAAHPDGAFALRQPQLLALETYWYLRLVLQTPQVADLYTQCFPDKDTWADALLLPVKAWQSVGASRALFLRKLQEDDSFVQEYRLDVIRETMFLTYPSYIFALAMGVGKTVLIGSFIASEFALSLTYPDGPFLHNALAFAPGRTIIESLRALIDMPYTAVLPPHLHKPFAAAVRFVVPQDGERTIPVLSGSSFNVIITNTEKIRIQKEKVRKQQIGGLLSNTQLDAAKAEVANLRLQTIASLPALGIFSDEAHHTYGRSLTTSLKKVRKTVDYIATKTSVRSVVNTTGTPYFGRQPLRDVVVSYGLAAGIRDGILKEVGNNVVVYDSARHNGRISGSTSAHDPSTRNRLATDLSLENNATVDNETAHNNVHQSHVRQSQQNYLATILRDIITDFFSAYGTVTLPDGTPAKLAIYFPKTADIAANRPLLERTLINIGYSPTLLLEHHTRSDNKVDFDRFHTRQSPHRVALLVDRGVEGWDVPALFACALVRKLKTSNNFVLQAASRCLRQIPGNSVPARIYLSAENQKLLMRQLKNTYGITFDEVTTAKTHARQIRAETRSPVYPQPRSLPQQQWHLPVSLTLSPPQKQESTSEHQWYRHQTTLWQSSVQDAEQGSKQDDFSSDGIDLMAHTATLPSEVDAQAEPVVVLYCAAAELAVCYHLPLLLVYRALHQAYQARNSLPLADLVYLRRQIEQQCLIGDHHTGTVARG